MKVLIVTDTRVYINGKSLYVDGPFSVIMRRYLNTFGNISLCTLEERFEYMPGSAIGITSLIEKIYRVEGQVASYTGKAKNTLREAVAHADLVIARVPSYLAYQAIDEAVATKKPYMTECMGCAWDAYWNHGLLGKILAPYMYLKMKSVIREANYASYVTERYLQNIYPCNNSSISASNVNIEVSDEIILQKRLKKIGERSQLSNLKILTAAAVNVRYKGQEYVIQAIPELNRLGIKVQYMLAGKGDNTFLKKLSEKLGVEEQVCFVGALQHDDLLKLMDEVDIYVQPSCQEGLPRSVLEAMSRACPCIGARTAGIPELLREDCVFKRKSAHAIAELISNLIQRDISNYAIYSFEKSKEYTRDILDARRNDYYNAILREVEESHC